MQLRHIFFCLFITSAIVVSVSDLPGQNFYSYLDENGIQVFTNIPPVDNSDSSDLLALNRNSAEEPMPQATNSKAGPRTFDSIINKYASHYALDPSLIHSIIATESGFNPNAVSAKGARGLMQLMPATAERWGVKNSFDPEQNIQAGVRHFRSLMDMFDNNLDLSLAAYNAGENLVQRLGRVPQYTETINYVESVTRRYVERRADTQDEEDPADAPTFRYVDTAGVLHLTNIPPTR